MVGVTSEVGRLRRVLVHEPGPEVDLMAPSMMEELLFDDILFGEQACEEDRIFCRVLRRFGVEVVEARDLLEYALAAAEARVWLLEGAFQDLPGDLRSRVREAPAAEVAGLLQVGLRVGAEAGEVDPLERGDSLYELPPLPNWCFQRDPHVVIGTGVAFASMAARVDS
jgi:arginine deiminase